MPTNQFALHIQPNHTTEPIEIFLAKLAETGDQKYLNPKKMAPTVPMCILYQVTNEQIFYRQQSVRQTIQSGRQQLCGLMGC
jgi:hypothetical protein